MINTHKIFIILFLLAIVKTATINSQNFPVPFDSIWYGFNAQTGSQNYYITYSKLVDLDNGRDKDITVSKTSILTGAIFSSSIYFYRIETPEFSASKKMMLLK